MPHVQFFLQSVMAETALDIFLPFLLNAEDTSLLVNYILPNIKFSENSQEHHFSQNAFVFVCFNKMWSTKCFVSSNFIHKDIVYYW